MAQNTEAEPAKNPNGDKPKVEDIHPDWLNVVRAAQAACKKNGGFGVMTIVVSLNKSVPILWNPILRHRLQPSRAAQVEMNPETALALMTMMDMYVDEPVVVPEQELT